MKIKVRDADPVQVDKGAEKQPFVKAGIRWINSRPRNDEAGEGTNVDRLL